MNSENFARFLNQEFKSRQLGWMAENVGGVVFIYGSNRNQLDSDTIATISFFANPPQIELSEKGKVHNKVVDAMWNEYLTGHTSNNVGKGTLSGEYNVVAITIVVGSAVLCLLAIVGGLALGSFIFG